jgi:uncharacterized repeat protein (TIGR02543 family)
MPSTPSKSGYTFGGWYTATNGGGTQFVASTPVTGNITVYAKWTVRVPATSLQTALTWLDSNAVEGGAYTITLSANESIGPRTLSYSGKQVSITIKGDTTERVVSLSANGPLFTVRNGVTLTLDSNITLQGRNNNNTILVDVTSGGTLMMNTGSKISGNTHLTTTIESYAIGSGVYVSYGAFTMNGGEISGNTASGGESGSGSGVHVYQGTFTMSGGEISGNTASSGGGVVVSGSSSSFSKTNGIIYGDTDAVHTPDSTENTATSGNTQGHAVYYRSPASDNYYRDTTLGTGNNISTAVTLPANSGQTLNGWTKK